MPIIKEILNEGNRIVVWQFHDGEFDPPALQHESIINVVTHPKRILERQAVLAILKYMGFADSYSYTPESRPFIPGSNQHISISHSGSMAVVAVNETTPVGVDVEQLNRPFDRVVKKYLSEEEQVVANAHDKQELALIWCVKEATYKLPWAKPCSLTEDIVVELDLGYAARGWCKVKVRNCGPIAELKANFIYNGGFCLAWVNR